jgi:hypothetical protein
VLDFVQPFAAGGVFQIQQDFRRATILHNARVSKSGDRLRNIPVVIELKRQKPIARRKHPWHAQLLIQTINAFRAKTSTKPQSMEPMARNIGEIDHLIIDKLSGRVAYAVMSFGGFMGLGHSHYPIP